jgi:hypothetical protein
MNQYAMCFVQNLHTHSKHAPQTYQTWIVSYARQPAPSISPVEAKDNSNHNSVYTEFINDTVSWLWFRILNLEMRLKETLSRCKGQTHETYTLSKTEKQKQSGTRNWRHGITGKKSRGGSDTSLIAWAFSEASIGITRNSDSQPEVHFPHFSFCIRTKLFASI